VSKQCAQDRYATGVTVVRCSLRNWSAAAMSIEPVGSRAATLTTEPPTTKWLVSGNNLKLRVR